MCRKSTRFFGIACTPLIFYFPSSSFFSVNALTPTAERDGKLVPTDPLLVGFLTNFASFLLLFPGHPEHGPFHLVKGLLNVVKSFKAWCVHRPNNTQCRQSMSENQMFSFAEMMAIFWQVLRVFLISFAPCFFVRLFVLLCEFRENASEAKTRVYLAILSLFCTYAQVKFPYHIDKGIVIFTCVGCVPRL